MNDKQTVPMPRFDLLFDDAEFRRVVKYSAADATPEGQRAFVVLERDEVSGKPLVVATFIAQADRVGPTRVQTVFSVRQFLALADVLRARFGHLFAADPTDSGPPPPAQGIIDGVGWEAFPAVVVTVEGGTDIGVCDVLGAAAGTAKALIEKRRRGAK